MSEWQPIETAPKDGRVILVYRHSEDSRYTTSEVYQAKWGIAGGDKEGSWLVGPHQNHKPTHWQPMMALPQPVAEPSKPLAWEPPADVKAAYRASLAKGYREMVRRLASQYGLPWVP